MMSRAGHQRWRKLALLAFLGLLSVAVIGNETTALLVDPYFLQYFARVRWSLALHVAPAAIMVFIAPLQFVDRIRTERPRLHRWAGYCYMGALGVSAPAALWTLHSHRSEFVHVTYARGAVWVLTAVLALLAARRRNFRQHRQWMIRNYALMLAFIFERAVNFVPAFRDLNWGLIFWYDNVFALVVADVVMNWGDLFAVRPARADSSAARTSSATAAKGMREMAAR